MELTVTLPPQGPQDHGWCSGYTCQLRLSLFHAMVATGRAFDVFFTSVSPQKLRLMLLNAPPTEVRPRPHGSRGGGACGVGLNNFMFDHILKRLGYVVIDRFDFILNWVLTVGSGETHEMMGWN